MFDVNREEKKISLNQDKFSNSCFWCSRRWRLIVLRWLITFPICFFFVGEEVKPFTPVEAKEIVMSLQEPAVFYNMAFDWPALHWDATCLGKLFAGKRIPFRVGMKDTGTGRRANVESPYQVLSTFAHFKTCKTLDDENNTKIKIYLLI